jgi:hypothetical protein
VWRPPDPLSCPVDIRVDGPGPAVVERPRRLPSVVAVEHHQVRRGVRRVGRLAPGGPLGEHPHGVVAPSWAGPDSAVGERSVPRRRPMTGASGSDSPVSATGYVRPVEPVYVQRRTVAAHRSVRSGVVTGGLLTVLQMFGEDLHAIPTEGALGSHMASRVHLSRRLLIPTTQFSNLVIWVWGFAFGLAEGRSRRVRPLGFHAEQRRHDDGGRRATATPVTATAPSASSRPTPVTNVRERSGMSTPVGDADSHPETTVSLPGAEATPSIRTVTTRSPTRRGHTICDRCRRSPSHGRCEFDRQPNRGHPDARRWDTDR